MSEELGFQKPRSTPNPMEPNQDDVDTIAKQMRTMPNYFAAMAAAASQNIRKGVNPTHQSSVSSTASVPPNSDLGYSSYHYHQQATPQYHPKFSKEIYNKVNNDWSVGGGTSYDGTEEATGRLPSMDENSALQNSVSKLYQILKRTPLIIYIVPLPGF